MASTVATSITNNSLTSLVDVTLNAAGIASGVVFWMITVTDGTDHQSLSGVTTYGAVNKAGTYSSTINNDTSNDAKALSAGTLTTTWDILTGSNKITLRVKAASSLTPSANYPKITYSIINDTPTAVTPL